MAVGITAKPVTSARPDIEAKGSPSAHSTAAHLILTYAIRRGLAESVRAPVGSLGRYELGLSDLHRQHTRCTPRCHMVDCCLRQLRRPLPLTQDPNALYRGKGASDSHPDARVPTGSLGILSRRWVQESWYHDKAFRLMGAGSNVRPDSTSTQNAGRGKFWAIA